MCHENFIIGYTSGVFDMFHIGHLNILKRAKELCDFLIVGVSTDELVREYKHKSPIISYDNRKAIVEACKYVDKVVPQVNRDKMSAYHRLHFDVMFVGDDWKGNSLFQEVEAELNKNGAKVVYFPYTKGISSTILRDKLVKITTMNVDIKDFQYKILEIAFYFDEFCKKYDIEYYLMGGSALGAVRHHGFIPWDDDFDVFMTFNNYHKFLHYASIHLDTEKFHLQRENSTEWPLFFSKLRMNGTTCIEKGYNKMHQGIYIDIMCLYNVSPNKFVRYIQYLSAQILKATSLYLVDYDSDSFFKKVFINSCHFVVGTTAKNFLFKILNHFSTKNTLLVGHFFGKAPFPKTSFPRKWLGIQRYVNFENLLLPIPFEAEKYLSLRYGSDFMKIPNSDIFTEYPIHAVFVDIHNDYTIYKDKFNS